MKTDTAKTPPSPAPAREPNIITVSELARMTEAQKEAFRQAGGTVCGDHAIDTGTNKVVK